MPRKPKTSVKSQAHLTGMLENRAIVEIQVGGFKSIGDEQRIEIRPLTILAGANSSGKSSMLQPALLLKQTLESSYDPGTLRLNGPNVKFTSTEQLLSRIGKGHSTDSFVAGIRLSTGESFKTTFRKEHKTGFRIEQMELTDESGTFNLWPEMTAAEIEKTGITKNKEHMRQVAGGFKEGRWKVTRDRCVLELTWVFLGTGTSPDSVTEHTAALLQAAIPDIIHLPGLRGNPERTYSVTAVGPSFPGTFEKYAASLLSKWIEESPDIIAALNDDLKRLQLTGGVSATQVNDAQIEIHVGRLPNVPPTRPDDRVNIADVGVGLSQTLPVLIALHAASPRHLVYVEQPEIHLHPRAQFELARVIAAAVNRGVRTIIETHSSLLLLGIQTQLAGRVLSSDQVKLHWFRRLEDGRTVVRSGDMDEAGRFGDWPEDFDDVTLHAQKEYLDAAEERLAQK